MGPSLGALPLKPPQGLPHAGRGLVRREVVAREQRTEEVACALLFPVASKPLGRQEDGGPHTGGREIATEKK